VHAALARNAVMHDRRPQILHAAAEEIPLADASVDAVLSTTVLCSVADPARALGEIRRVLREGGRFIFFEHVVAPPGTCSRRLQRALAPFSRRFDHGCDPGRDTVATISEAGFAAMDLRWYAKAHRPALYGLFVAGIAQEGGPSHSSVGTVIAA
jgi:ubiquinone/menaquinone biosynthesis C-methylase UbiE